MTQNFSNLEDSIGVIGSSLSKVQVMKKKESSKGPQQRTTTGPITGNLNDHKNKAIIQITKQNLQY